MTETPREAAVNAVINALHNLWIVNDELTLGELLKHVRRAMNTWADLHTISNEEWLKALERTRNKGFLGTSSSLSDEEFIEGMRDDAEYNPAVARFLRIVDNKAKELEYLSERLSKAEVKVDKAQLKLRRFLARFSDEDGPLFEIGDLVIHNDSGAKGVVVKIDHIDPAHVDVFFRTPGYRGRKFTSPGKYNIPVTAIEHDLE